MDGDVDVRVEHSTVNYKDGLAITGKLPVVRRLPMIPGIDFAGTVTASSQPGFQARRQCHPQRLGRRRGASRRLSPDGAGEGRLADPAARRPRPRPRRWRSAPPATRRCSAVMALERHGISPASRPGRGDRGGRRRRLGGRRAPRPTRLHVHRRRPAAPESRLSDGARGRRDRSTAPSSPGRPKPLAKERWAGGVDAVGGAISSPTSSR